MSGKSGKTVRLAVFECDGCGACCRHLIIEADHLDALREPRIAAEARLLDGKGKVAIEDAAWGMNRGDKDGLDCVFLGKDNRCGIYATRPGVCVSMQAGSEQCRDARRMAGLAPLAPTRQAATMLNRLHVLAREGENE